MNPFTKATMVLILGGSMALFSQSRLSDAAINCDLKKAQKCVEEWTMSPNDFDRWGWTPFIWAVYNDCVPVTVYLLSKGADTNVSTKQDYGSMYKGSTPIMIAAYYDKDALVEMLLKAGADPYMADSKGSNAFDFAKRSETGSTLVVLNRWKDAHSK